MRDACQDAVITLAAMTERVLDGAHEHVPTPAVHVVDTVGAGDAYCGGLGARLAAGDDLLTAARWASAAAALSVTKDGAEPSLPLAAAVDARLLRGA